MSSMKKSEKFNDNMNDINYDEDDEFVVVE